MSSRVFIRKPVESDWAVLLHLHQRSQSFHFPWSFPSVTEEGCKQYLQRCQQDTFEGSLICEQQSQTVVGIANLSQIFYGPFQNRNLGFVKKDILPDISKLMVNGATTNVGP